MKIGIKNILSIIYIITLLTGVLYLVTGSSIEKILYILIISLLSYYSYKYIRDGNIKSLITLILIISGLGISKLVIIEGFNTSMNLPDTIYTNILIFLIDLVVPILFIQLFDIKNLSRYIRIGYILILGIIHLFIYKDIISIVFSIKMYIYTIVGMEMYLKYKSKSDTGEVSRYLNLIFTIFVSIIFSVSIYQFLLGRNLGLYILGESRIYTGGYKVATEVIQALGAELLLQRSYGLLPHPNILGFWSVVIFCWSYIVRNRLTIVISFLILIISLSVSSYLSFTILITIIIYRYVSNSKNKLLISIYAFINMFHNRYLIKLLVIIFTTSTLALGLYIVFNSHNKRIINEQSAMSSRIEQTIFYLEHISIKEYLIGIGLGRHTTYAYKSSLLTDRGILFLEPLHNTPLILLIEIGMIPLIFIMNYILVLSPVKNKKLMIALIVVSPILLLDHHIMTISVSLMLFIILIVLSAISFSNRDMKG